MGLRPTLVIDNNTYITMNLIICCTPLQTLIAGRIMDEHPDEKFYLIAYHNKEDKKLVDYYQRLRKRSAGGQIIKQIELDSYWGKYWVTIRMLLWGLRHCSKPKVFLANIEKAPLHLIIPWYKHRKIYTFDDGLRNLATDHLTSPLLQSTEPGRLLKMLIKIFGVPNMHDLHVATRRHFSIYQYPNKMPRASHIPLLDDGVIGRREEKRVHRIFIGQSMYFDGKLDKELTERVLKLLDIDSYLPHPSESYKVEGVTYIKTLDIAEDYILKQLHSTQDTIEIYSFTSTVLINFHQSPRVRCVMIIPDRVLPYFEPVYTFMHSCGIQALQLQRDADGTDTLTPHTVQ